MPAPAKPFKPLTARLLMGMTALVMLAAGCSSVDVERPKAERSDPNAGTFTTADGVVFKALPEDFDYTGAGTYVLPTGIRQEGFFQAGRLQGMGSETGDGVTYTGQWHNGVRHGHGELVSDNGDRYVGDFVEGQPEGKGTATTSAGVYRGTWQAGRYDGQGQFNDADGSVYQGQWQAGLRQGFGFETAVDGSSYQGEWAADLPNGFGRFSGPAGETFEGSWINGQRQGYGVATHPAGTRYEGTWFENLRNGYGREDRPDGSYYAGEWQAGQRHGKGTEVHADGSSHKGFWQNDEIAGEGTRTNTAGIQISGMWQGNLIEKGTLTLPAGQEYAGMLFSINGRGVASDLLEWLVANARDRDPNAAYFLGYAYLDFEDPPPDPRAARVWLSRAAELGQADAQFRLSQLLLEEDASNALDLLREAAAQNHPLAHATLGEYRHSGRYLERDFSAAITHYESAFARGNVSAANNLAWLLATTDDARYADAERAVTLIQPLVLYLGNWQHLDTLAAAHARLGQTDLAARLQKEALSIAERQAGEGELVQMRARLSLYQAALPYIENTVSDGY